MKIAILLPYKENFSKYYAGAVSIFVNSTYRLSKFKNNINIYGSTLNKPLNKKYKNISLKKKIFQSSSKNYLVNFINKIKDQNINIIEIHNRPHYVNLLKNELSYKKILFFHNDPLEMLGSISSKERLDLLNQCDQIIFNSNWTKNRFLKDINLKKNSEKLHVVLQSTSKININFNKKKKIISFIGKFNESKGFDIFGGAILRILNKYKDWKAIIIGDEPRQKLYFEHDRLINYGFKDNQFILNKLKTVSIAVVPSKWNEPFGRASLEASSRGCAVIRSNTGGLKETSKDSIIINHLTEDELFDKIEMLIINTKLRQKIQRETHKNFKLTNENSTTSIDLIRDKLIVKNLNFSVNLKKNLKIFHITNFNERFDGRLHYNTGKRFNNGMIRLNHNVLNLSDRDIVSSNRSLFDPKATTILNNKIINNFKNFDPDLIVLGHADSVNAETIEYLKNKKPSLKIIQWFLDPITSKGPDFINNKRRLIQKSEIVDATFITTDPNSLEFKVKNCFFIPNPADISFEILENYKKNCHYDIFFAMSHGVHRGKLKKGKTDNREIFLKKLMVNKDIKFNFFGVENSQPIWGKNFLSELSNCKMGLNLSRGVPVKYYSSDRIAQLMGNGLLTFIDEKTQYRDFFNKKEIITYKNSDDLEEKIMKFKKDDKSRKLIAKNGRMKYLKYLNSTLISKYMINKTFDIKSKEKFIWL